MGRGVRPVALTGSDQTVRPFACSYHGYSVRETAAAAAVLRIYDGTSAAGTLLDTVSLSANESAREYYPDEGIRADVGVFVDVVSGVVEGSVRVG